MARKKAPKISTLKKATSNGKPMVSHLSKQPPTLMGLVSTTTLNPGQGPPQAVNPNPPVRGLGSAKRKRRAILKPSASASRRARG